MPLRILVSVIAFSQIVLSIMFLCLPSVMYSAMGIPPAAPGMTYILGMFSARLFVYGVVLFMIGKDLPRHRLWLDGMIAIQVLDFAVGTFVVGIGWVVWSSAVFPMVNAAAFTVALLWLRPRDQQDGFAV